MPGNFRLVFNCGDGYVRRVIRALDRKRIAAVALTTVLLSLGALGSPALLDFFSPAEIALAWLEHLLELSVIAALLMVAYTLLDEGMPRRWPGRLAAICALLFVFAGVLTAPLWLLRARLRTPAACAAPAGRFAALGLACGVSGADCRCP